MEQVAQMLGVELEEEFKLDDSDDYKYKITKDGMFMYSGFASDWFSANHILLGVLIGKYEIKKPILDDIERRYLSNVIRPFRDRVAVITKLNYGDYEKLMIEVKIMNSKYKFDGCCLPRFNNGTMYKGMETNKGYTLEELGL